MNNWNHVPRYLTKNYSEILERGKFDTLTHMYMTSYFPEFVHALAINNKSALSIIYEMK
jgi:hypothetical protein